MCGGLRIGTKAASKSRALFKKTLTNSTTGIPGIPKPRPSYYTEHDPMNTPVSVWHGK
jgi:hypothetical protein